MLKEPEYSTTNKPFTNGLVMFVAARVEQRNAHSMK